MRTSHSSHLSPARTHATRTFSDLELEFWVRDLSNKPGIVLEISLKVLAAGFGTCPLVLLGR